MPCMAIPNGGNAWHSDITFEITRAPYSKVAHSNKQVEPLGSRGLLGCMALLTLIWYMACARIGLTHALELRK